MPNFLAFLVLGIWPFVVAHFFKKFDPVKAVIWTYIGSYLFLPVKTEFDLKVLPEVGKETLPSIVLLFLLRSKFKDFKLKIEDTVTRRLVIVFLISPIFTILANGDALNYGPITLPGLGVKDALAPIFNNIFMYIVPLIVGRHFLGTIEAHKQILIALVWAGAIYSVPILWEIRMSPQLHTQIYGFFPHEFAQQFRFGGYRPVVFMGHGLLVAFFVATSVAAATCLHRRKDALFEKAGNLKIAFALTILVICKSVGPIMYGVVMFLFIKFTRPKVITRVSAILVLIVFIFPILRSEGLFPVKELVEYAASHDQKRADSLLFRFNNEDILLKKVELRPILGWGTWGRNQIYNPYTGEVESITDGSWVIVLGAFGYVGFVSFFGLLCYIPIKLHLKVAGSKKEVLSIYTATVSLLLGFNLIDLLPNSSLTPLTLLFCGALVGYLEKLNARKPYLEKSSEPSD